MYIVYIHTYVHNQFQKIRADRQKIEDGFPETIQEYSQKYLDDYDTTLNDNPEIGYYTNITSLSKHAYGKGNVNGIGWRIVSLACSTSVLLKLSLGLHT